MTEGTERIAAERQRQIEKEGWTPEHDDEHDGGELALAAVCFAAPTKILVGDLESTLLIFRDPWPDTWLDDWDKRLQYGANLGEDGDPILPDPKTYTDDERIDLLTKAGALIAAEIDRLIRKAARDR